MRRSTPGGPIRRRITTGGATGSVTLNLFTSPADLSGTLVSGTPTTAALSTIGQNASYTISGTSGQYLAVKFSNDSIASAKVTAGLANWKAQ